MKKLLFVGILIATGSTVGHADCTKDNQGATDCKAGFNVECSCTQLNGQYICGWSRTGGTCHRGEQSASTPSSISYSTTPGWIGASERYSREAH